MGEQKVILRVIKMTVREQVKKRVGKSNQTVTVTELIDLFFTGFGKIKAAENSPLFCSNKSKAQFFTKENEAEEILKKINNPSAEVVLCE